MTCSRGASRIGSGLGVAGELRDGADFHAAAEPQGRTSLGQCGRFVDVLGCHQGVATEPGRGIQPAQRTRGDYRVTGVAHAYGMLVLTLAGGQVTAMTGFDNSVLPLFGLPRTLPGHG